MLVKLISNLWVEKKHSRWGKGREIRPDKDKQVRNAILLEKTCGEGDTMWLVRCGGRTVAQQDYQMGLVQNGMPPLA